MQTSEVSGQLLPVAGFVLSGPTRLKEEEVLEVGENVGGSHAPGGTKSGKTRNFDSEQPAGDVGHCLGHEVGSVGIGQQPSLRNGTAGESNDFHEPTCSPDRG